MAIPSHCVAVAKLRNPAVHIAYFPDRSVFLQLRPCSFSIASFLALSGAHAVPFCTSLCVVLFYTSLRDFFLEERTRLTIAYAG
jgi:hypothetical protein